MKYFRLLLLLMMAFGMLNAKELLIIGSTPVLPGKYIQMEDSAKKHNITLRYMFAEKISEDNPDNILLKSDMVLLDVPRDHIEEYVKNKIPNTLKAINDRGIKTVWMNTKQPINYNISSDAAKRLHSYWVNGGAYNVELFYEALELFLDNKSMSSVAEALVFPLSAIYYPGEKFLFKTPQEYVEYRGIDGSKPIIGIIFHQQAISGQQSALIDDMIKSIESKGAIAWAFYTPVLGQHDIENMVVYDSKVMTNILINNQIMLNPNDRKAEFERLGIPVLQAMGYKKGTLRDYLADTQGVSLSDVPFYMSQAEFAGVTDIQVASVMDDNAQIVSVVPQLEAVVDKAINLIRLQTIENSQKRVTILFYNYPPGVKNLSASFMNVPKSLTQTLKSLKSAGYDTREYGEEELIKDLQRLLEPYYFENKLEQLVKDNLAGTISIESYKKWLESLPKYVQDELYRDHGKPEDSPMIITKNGKKYFAVPRLEIGNIVMMPQATRADYKSDDIVAKEKALYHNTTASPSHGYLAMYLWTKLEQKSDALVHYGTHGNQEWLPGKERGLSVYDYPMLAVGDVPVVYPYIIDNIGESLQAKRRGRATTITYQTPPFAPAGLHDSLVRLHDELHDWISQDEGAVKNKIELSIKQQVKKEHILENMGLNEKEAYTDFRAFIDELHIHIHDLAKEAQPLGLHTFGVSDEESLRISNVLMMVGLDSFNVAMSEDEAEDMFVDDYKKLHQSKPYQWIKEFVVDGRSLLDFPSSIHETLLLAATYYEKLDATNETKAFLAALDGKYIETTYGGDPMKNPDTLPTGRNMYGFDPSRVPTKAAWEAGKDAVNQLIENYKAQHNKMPKKLTFSLWSVETMRHQGILEAQAFYAMGIEPVWDNAGKVVDVKLIDREDLGRSRIDVILSATGLYRDHFPNVLKHLAKAAQLVSEADEDDNPAFANAKKIEQALIKKGFSQQDAHDASVTRIFTSESGKYGTGLDDATLASDTWGDEKDGNAKLANLYLSKMQYAYGPDESKWGQKANGVNLYAEHLSGTDAAVLSRTSNLYGMLTTDDPFQYLGGISVALKHIDGKAPELFISNLRGGGGGKVESAAVFMSRELSTRNFHPGYIEGLMKEGYAGTLQALDGINNFWGWTAVAKEVVRDDQWDEFVDVYVNDKHNIGVNEWFEKNNPNAQAQMIERMLEANRKGYWKTKKSTIDALKKKYNQLASKHNIKSDNSTFEKFVKASGYGLNGASAAAKATAKAEPKPQADVQKPNEQQEPKEQKKEIEKPKPNIVKGVKLEKVVPQKPSNNDGNIFVGAGVVGLSILLGIVSGF